MWVLITLLWLMVAYRAIKILALGVLSGTTSVVQYTPGTVASGSLGAMFSGALLALTALLLTQYAYGG